MRHIFDQEGERALDALLRRQPLLAFDFDGTLSPIVERPEDATILPELVDDLVRLASLRPVAIVTGRSLDDVRSRLGLFVPRYIIGNHGDEDPALAPQAETGSSLFDPLRERIASQADDLRHAGVLIEDKNSSLALHYRRAPDHQVARTAIEALLKDLDPALKSYGGKCVVNVVAANARDKGDAVVALLKRSESDCAFFVGDDLNDEAVFARALPHWLTVRVGHDPDSRAQFYLERQSDMTALLKNMVRILTHS